MEIPLEITFQNMATSQSLSADIRKRVAKLEKFYGRLISCRVSIEERSKQHRKGNVYEVHVEMHAPHGHLVVSREPHHPKERHARPDVRAPVRDPFKAAEEQLRGFRRIQHVEVKQHGEAKPGAAVRA